MEYRLKTVDLKGPVVKGMPEHYADTAYMIVSASKYSGAEHLEKNAELNAKLKARIRKSGYFHTPIWGGFKSDGSDAILKEQSFIVFNFKGHGEERPKDSLRLRDLGEICCSLFDQEAFFYKEEGPSNKGYFVDSHGEVTMTSYEARPLQAADIYFTLLKQKAKKTADKSSILTYVEGTIYVARRPMTPNGDTVAARKRECFILS